MKQLDYKNKFEKNQNKLYNIYKCPSSIENINELSATNNYMCAFCRQGGGERRQCWLIDDIVRRAVTAAVVTR